jgi:predicted nucleic acid-binding protein
MFVVDASVWVARYKPGDTNHVASQQWIYNVLGLGQEIVGPTLLLPEVTGPLSRESSEFNARRALRELGRILNLRVLPLGHELSRHAASLAAQFRLRGADSVYVALARQLGMPLVTWDGEQHARASAVVLVQTPAQLLEAPP